MGRDEALDSLLERLAAAESAQAEGFLGQAEAALADGDPEGAVAAVQQAIALRPDEDAFRTILKRAEDAIERRRRLASAVTEIEAALQGHDLRATREALDRAQEGLGDDPALSDLRKRLESAERQATAAEVARLVALAGKHLAEDRLEDAREAAQRAHELMPLSWEAAAALADTKAAEEKRAAEDSVRPEERRLAEERAAEEKRGGRGTRSRGGGAGRRAAPGRGARRGGRDDPAPGRRTAICLAAQQVLEETRSCTGKLAGAGRSVRRSSTAPCSATRAASSPRRCWPRPGGFVVTSNSRPPRSKLDEAIAISPTNERVLAGAGRGAGGGPQAPGGPGRARAVAEEVAAIGTALDAGRLTEAAERFDAAIRKLGDRPELAAMRLGCTRRAARSRSARPRSARPPRRRAGRRAGRSRTGRPCGSSARRPCPQPSPPPASRHPRRRRQETGH